MKLILLAAVTMLVDAHGASAHQTTQHHEVTHPAVSGQPADAQRWQADAPLQAGMARVRIASDALGHMQHGHLNARQVTALANEISAAVNDMFEKCKLDPAPDAALHPLLAKLLVASQSLRAKPMEAAPVQDVQAVLASYEKLFSES